MTRGRNRFDSNVIDWAIHTGKRLTFMYSNILILSEYVFRIDTEPKRNTAHAINLTHGTHIQEVRGALLVVSAANTSVVHALAARALSLTWLIVTPLVPLSYTDSCMMEPHAPPTRWNTRRVRASSSISKTRYWLGTELTSVAPPFDVDGWMNEWMDEWMDGWMDGWMDKWMDGWREGWME